MWFIRGRPKSINVHGFVTSVPKGYQEMEYRFKIEAEPEKTKDGKLWVALTAPWSPNKENGSIKIIDQKDKQENTEYVSENDVEIFEKPRKLRNFSDAELILVQDMCQWYLEDFGIISFWVQAGKWYQINYRHKIAANSKLFFPTRLPSIVINSDKPELDFTISVKDSLHYDVPKHLKKIETKENSIVYKIIDDWHWENDTEFNTENWESSDDELIDDSEQENDTEN